MTPPSWGNKNGNDSATNSDYENGISGAIGLDLEKLHPPEEHWLCGFDILDLGSEPAVSGGTA